MKGKVCLCFPWKQKIGNKEESIALNTPTRLQSAWASSNNLQTKDKITKLQDLNTIPNTKEKLLFIGLEGSGKTSVINSLHGHQSLTHPTRTLTTSSYNLDARRVQLLDAPEDFKWRAAGSELFGCVFIVDAQDLLRLALARRKLNNIVEHPDYATLPILIVINKAEGGKEREIVKRQLNLQSLPHHNWVWCFCSTRTGEGVSFIKKWMSNPAATQ